MTSLCGQTTEFFECYISWHGDPSGRGVYGMSVRRLACRSCGSKSHQGHECLFHVNVVCSGLSDRTILPRVACLSVMSKPQQWRGLGPLGAVEP